MENALTHFTTETARDPVLPGVTEAATPAMTPGPAVTEEGFGVPWPLRPASPESTSRARENGMNPHVPPPPGDPRDPAGRCPGAQPSRALWEGDKVRFRVGSFADPEHRQGRSRSPRVCWSLDAVRVGEAGSAVRLLREARREGRVAGCGRQGSAGAWRPTCGDKTVACRVRL